MWNRVIKVQEGFGLIADCLLSRKSGPQDFVNEIRNTTCLENRVKLFLYSKSSYMKLHVCEVSYLIHFLIRFRMIHTQLFWPELMMLKFI